MKTLFLSLFLLVIGLSQLQAQEKYFHELRGMEDSTGTTHLFYRLYQTTESDYFCSITSWRNDVFHYNAFEQSDSLKFSSERICQVQTDPLAFTQDYAFLLNDPAKWYSIFNRQSYLYGQLFTKISAFNSSFFDVGPRWGNRIEVSLSDSLAFATLGFGKKSVIIILDDYQLPSERYPYSILAKQSYKNNQQHCEVYNDCFYGASDSVSIIDYNFLAINRTKKQSIFLTRNDTLFVTDNLGKSVYPLNHSIDWNSIGQMGFSNDSLTIIATTDSRFDPDSINQNAAKYNLYISNDAGVNWRIIDSSEIRIFIPADFRKGYPIYYARNDTIFSSDDNGNSFDTYLSLEDSITGIYQKADSDILYVLTFKELLEVNDGTASVLKKLPVSNEETPELPTQTTLHQNYPNPFNPTTTIQFELVKPAFTQLTVYDALGRKIRTLIEEQRPAGLNSVPFDASELASGVYLYRLEAGGLVQTRKMMLIK